MPYQSGIPPHVRIGGSKWFNLLWLVPIGFVLLVAAVAVAKELRQLDAVQSFIAAYPGTIEPANGREGISVWVNWQHFFNLFLMTFIIRSGIQIMTDHPRLYWTRHSTPGREWFRFQKEVPSDPLWTAKQDSVNVPGGVRRQGGEQRGLRPQTSRSAANRDGPQGRRRVGNVRWSDDPI